MTFGEPPSQRLKVSSRQHVVYFNLSKVVRRFHNF